MADLPVDPALGQVARSFRDYEAEEARRSRTRAAKPTGYSATSLRKVQAVEAAAAADPEHYGDLLTQMDRSGKGSIHTVYRAFLARHDAHAAPAEHARRLGLEIRRLVRVEARAHSLKIYAMHRLGQLLQEHPASTEIAWPPAAQISARTSSAFAERRRR